MGQEVLSEVRHAAKGVTGGDWGVRTGDNEWMR